MSEKSNQLGKEYIDSMLDPNGSFTQYGLTKREYFAGIAMQGLLANANGAMTEGSSRTFSPDGISDLALKHADALLEKLSTEAQS
jgi:hypothetical protein